MDKQMHQKIYYILTVVVLSVIIMLCGCSGEKVKPVNPLMKFLPMEKDIPGWALVDSVMIFDSEGLWEYINGGAEQFLKYGFKQVLVGEYADSLETNILLEIFEMTDSAAAAGIYLDRANDSGAVVGLGYASSMQDYYLNFVNDRYLVTLTGFDSGIRYFNGIVKIATAVDDKIKKYKVRR